MSTLTLQDWLDQLECLHPREIDLGLDRIRSVAGRLGWSADWKPAPLVVTIAGTNGKGSTLGLLESILIEAGIRVGTYTSPHLLRYNERVRINGTPATDSAFCAAFETVEQARADTSLTYFEFGTLGAFQLIADQQVEVALLEVGLGGRLDAVNLVDPDLAIITGIALDHMDWLGDNREAIGTEKAGILRNNAMAVIGDPDPPASILAATAQVQSRVVYAGKDFGVSTEPDQAPRWWGVKADGQPIEIALPASTLHPHAIASALQAAELLKPGQISPDIIMAGIRNCVVPGRCQLFEIQQQKVVIDVSHNPQAATHLADYLDRLSPSSSRTGSRRAIIGMLRDKAIAGTITPLLDWADEWHVIGSPGERGMSAFELAAEVRKLTTKPVSTAASAASALRQLLVSGQPDDIVAGFGSFSVAGSLIHTIAEMHQPD